jgi:hypothetical protein
MDVNYYHYTPEYRLKEIIESGEIKLATASVYASKEKACAWVSTNPHWEHTATKSLRDEFGNIKILTFTEQLEILGCTRIQVKPIGLTHWAKIKHLAKMDLEQAKRMENVGLMKGANSKEWFGSFLPIKKENWIKFEIYRNGEWVDYKVF